VLGCDRQIGVVYVGTFDMFDGNYVSATISVPKGRAPLKPRPAEADQVAPLAEGAPGIDSERAATRQGVIARWLESRRVRMR
jgi:hypothetical protein